MSILEFIASVVSATAWPVVILIAILLFRGNIGRRIENIRRLTWGDKSVDFGEKLERIEKEAVTLIPDPGLAKQLPPPNDEGGRPDENPETARFESVLEADPRLAIVHAWAAVEREMQRVAIERGYGPQAKSGTFLIRRLAADGVLDRETTTVLDGLRTLRNEVVHGSGRQVSAEEARRYHELAELIIAKLQETAEA